jgi:hypothetical protein
MQDTNVDELLVRIAQQQSELLQEMQKPRKSQKDFWDRLTAVSPIIAASIMALIGAYFTYSYNQQLVRVQEIQTIEKFIPHLTGDEKAKRAAILAISSMGNAPLAAKVARMFASEGTASRSIAATSESKDKEVVEQALKTTLNALADRYRAEGKSEAMEEFKRSEEANSMQPVAPQMQGPVAPKVAGERSLPVTTVTVTPRTASERTTVEAVHIKQPEPHTDAYNTVEGDEAQYQHTRPSLAESAHSKQQ